MKKTYLAIAEGKFSNKQGLITAPLGRDRKNYKRIVVDTVTGREAVTEYTVLNSTEKYTLLELRPRTGRTHQIRVHLNAIGHSLCGDPVYFPPELHRTYLFPRVMLHAWKISFVHPKKHQPVEYTAPIAEDMRKVINDLELNTVNLTF